MIFLRHPTPDIAQGICYGQTDMGIATVGHQQIEIALEETPALTRIIASPAKRCRKLAEQLAKRDGLALEFDARLWEMHMGDWEGIAWKDIDIELSSAWLTDAHNNATPNGECFRDVQKRVGLCIAELIIDDDHNHTNTAVICHASPIRATQMAWENLTFSEAFSQSPPYAKPIIVNPPS